MRDAVIVEAVRTPLGRRNGVLSTIHPADLSAQILVGLADRTGLDPRSRRRCHLGLRQSGRRADR